MVLAVTLALPGRAAAAHAHTGWIETQEADDPTAARSLPADDPLIPLDAALKLNGRFVATVSVDVSMDGGRGRLNADTLRTVLGPLVSPRIDEALAAAPTVDGAVSLADASVDGLSVVFDPFGLELLVTVAGGDLATVPLAVRAPSAAPDPDAFDTPAGFAAALNVAVEQGFAHYGDAGAGPFRTLLEGTVRLGGFTGVQLSGGAVGTGDDWRRLPVTLIRDDFDRALRAAAGEVVPLTDGFQRAPRLLGAGIFRAYGTIRPFEVIRQSGRQSFVLERDAEARIYANGVLTEQLTLTAGSYELSDFPLAAGGNAVTIEVEDIAGEVSRFGFDLFSDAQLLDRGVTEFAAFVGTPERGELRYDDELVASGFVRRGVATNLTVGLNGQVTRTGALGGASLRTGGALGYVEVDAAVSRSEAADSVSTAPEARSGAAVSVDIRRSLELSQRNIVQATGNVTYRTPAFADAFARDFADPFRWNAAARLSGNLPGAIGVTLGGGYARGGGERIGGEVPESWSVDLSLFKSFGDLRLGTTYGVAGAVGEDLDHRLTFTLTATPTRRTNVAARYDTASDRLRLDARLLGQEALGNLSGAIAVTEGADGTALRADAVYVQNRARLEVQHDHVFASGEGRDDAETRLRAASTIGFAGGRLGIGRPASAGFVVAPIHQSLQGSRVAITNGDRVIARSGWLGPPLVPLDRSYSVNRFDLRVDPLPVGYDLGAGSISTFPAPGVGYRMQIGSDASRIALGFIMGPDGPLALAAGVVRPAGEPDAEGRAFFTNRGGRFVADGLSAGAYEAWVGDTVVARFEIPKEAEGMVDVGVLHAE